MSRALSFLAPGSYLGVLGGGQLGRMFCQSAQAMGYKVAVLDPDPLSPAASLAELHIQTAYDDAAGLARLAELCQAVTTEFENVPASSLQALQQTCIVAPAGAAVAVAQDRLQEKAWLGKAAVPVAAHAAVTTLADLQNCAASLFPGVLKTARFGYDGKGQVRVDNRAQAVQGFAQLGAQACILEALQPLAYEISVIVVRGRDGASVSYLPSRNFHHNGILALAVVDGTIAAQVATQARAYALRVAQQLDYQGVLCVEFFVLSDGSVIANEIAPRPHNSGHITQDLCQVSQFEQQARVLAGLPLGNTTAHGMGAMLNLLGDCWFDAAGHLREPDWGAVLAIPGTRLHLYGKAQARRARKMGHINILADTREQLWQRIQAVSVALGLDPEQFIDG